MDCGIVRPSFFTVLRLITNSNLDGCAPDPPHAHLDEDSWRESSRTPQGGTGPATPPPSASLGLTVLVWPARGVLLFVFVWKLASEAFRPLAGEPVWEFVERAGSYGAPLALAWLQSVREEPAKALLPVTDHAGRPF
jgi:hypothetical protein